MKLIESAYMQQYAAQDNVAWSQLDFTMKALLIDDFDASLLNTPARREALAAITMKFGVVMVTCDETLLLQTAVPDSEFYGFQRYQLPEFGHRLRDALIGKWVRLGREVTLEQAPFQVLREQQVRAINQLLGQSFIASRPIFLLTILQSMEMGAESAIRGSSLGEYYEYLIRHSLIGARVDPQDLDAVLNYLTEMGYFLLSRDHPSADSGELSEFDSNFAKRYAIKINFESLHRQLREADIIEEWNDRVRFKYRYVLLFFSARYLARHFAHDAEARRLVQAIGHRLATPKFSNLMLFIVHHSNDPEVLNIVLEESAKAFADQNPLRLDQADTAPLNSLVIELPRFALNEEPTEKHRERALRSKDRQEVRQSNHSKDETDLSLSSLQDTDTVEALDQLQQLTYGLRLLGILGQVLRNYYGSLRAERKEEIAKPSYALLGRMMGNQFNRLFGDSK